MDALIAELLPYHSGIQSEGISGEFNTLTAMPAIVKKRDMTTIVASIIVGGVIAVLMAMVLATAYMGFSVSEPVSPEVSTPEPAETKGVPEVEPKQPVPSVAPPPVVEPPRSSAPRSASKPVATPPPPSSIAAPTEPQTVDPSPAPEPEGDIPPPTVAPPVQDWADEDLEAGGEDWR